MFANSNCTAPEAVAASRRLGRDLVPADLVAAYLPAVRFYFEWDIVARHPAARFDGVHPIKIAGPLPLNRYLVAAVVPADDWPALRTAVPAELASRVAVLDTLDPTPQQWACDARAAAERPL